MTWATMEFDLDNTDDREDFTLTVNARCLHSAVWDLDQWLRKEIKHGSHDSVKEKTLEECRAKLHEMLEENDVSLLW